VELIRCFRKAAGDLGIELRALAADLNPAMSPACREADAAFMVPHCTRKEFVDVIQEICLRENVNLVIPTIDTELLTLSKASDRFRQIGTVIQVSTPEIISIARDKLRSTRTLAAYGIPVPRTGLLADVWKSPEDWRWPLILKPRFGSNSQGIIRLAGPNELPPLHTLSTHIAQELWSGKEYTVNMFFDLEGRIRATVPHLRYQTRGGEVSGRFERALSGARGVLCYQAIVRGDGSAVVFEVNARFGGGYPLVDHAGASFARWLLEELCGLRSTAGNLWREGTVMLRYDAAIFTSLEPTS
jgi:carbamoyl-phosphate synthase large subunit